MCAGKDTQDSVKWRNKTVVPDPMPELSGTASTQQGMQPDLQWCETGKKKTSVHQLTRKGANFIHR